MKRIAAFLMTLVLVGISCIALADTTFRARTFDLGGMLDRVKLRETPSTNGKILGQYFSGVIFEVLEEKGDWGRVRIGDREGYMMLKFLTTEFNENDASFEGQPGAACFPGPEDTLPLYSRPDDTSDILASMPAAGNLHVLGTISDEWLHVRYQDEQGQFIYGYASGIDVTMSENFATFTVDTKDAAQMLNLRQEPSQASKSLGQYFCGTTVYSLFDDHTNGDGWEKVRIGEAVGYMLPTSLDHSTGGVYSFYPPLSEALHDSVPVYDTANGKEESGSLSQNEAFSVLGMCGERYYVRIETKEPYQYRYGYVEKLDVQSVTRSASATGSIRYEQVLYLVGQNGELKPTEFVAPAGSKAYILGSLKNGGQTTASSYIDPGAQWLSCAVEIGNIQYMGTVVPLDAVQYDKGLEYHAVHLQR